MHSKYRECYFTHCEQRSAFIHLYFVCVCVNVVITHSLCGELESFSFGVLAEHLCSINLFEGVC